MTTNCLMRPRESYKDRIYSTNVVGWEGIKHIGKKENGDKDFSEIIQQAIELGGYPEDQEPQEILVGFGHHATLSYAEKIVEAVRAGKIRHFFLIDGCDGARPGRNYYTEFARMAPEDCIILTLACGKYRFNKVEFSGENAPYSAAGRYYLRTADEDREVTPDELKAFFVANKYRELWEKGKSNATAKQIDKPAIKSFWQKAVSAGRLPDGRYTCPIILKRFGLVCDNYLTNAGEILFGNTRPVSLKAGIFATDEKLTFLDMKLFEDNIYNLLNIAEEYILKNIRWRSEITGMEREETPEIPVAVIREVLANSFAHAIYNGRTTHEICIHPGMITVYSPGEYASKHKPEEYIKDNIESEIRNATIAKILYLSKSIEQFGSGFKRINSLCNDAGIKYSYENRENGFKFVIYRPELQSDIPSVTLDVTLDVTLNGTEMAVLAILKQKSDSSRDEIADKISKTVRTVQRALDSLRDKGYIRRVGSKQNPVWEILK